MMVVVTGRDPRRSIDCPDYFLAFRHIPPLSGHSRIYREILRHAMLVIIPVVSTGIVPLSGDV